MSELEHAHDELEAVVKGTLEINAGLENILRRKEVRRTSKHLHNAFQDQIDALLKSGMFKAIDKKIGAPKGHVTKAESERLSSESDDAEVYDTVDEYLPQLEAQDNTKEVLTLFLILVFNLGGQDFLNKHNIPATFDLQNDVILQRIADRAKRTLKGVDDTTVKWVSDQIISGRSDGLSNADIADLIREAVPPTFEGRADMIVRTETSFMVGDSEYETASNNGASHKYWTTVGGACPICAENEDAGTIGIDDYFPSGDPMEPAHPNCRCIVEYEFTPFMGTIWSGQ